MIHNLVIFTLSILAGHLFRSVSSLSFAFQTLTLFQNTRHSEYFIHNLLYDTDQQFFEECSVDKSDYSAKTHTVMVRQQHIFYLKFACYVLTLSPVCRKYFLY